MVFCLFIFSAISAESLACPQCHNPLEIDWRYFSLSTQKKIVQDYVYALDSFAIAMPIVGGDAESTWAADTVHVMAKRVKEGQRAFLESMSEIYQMQNYIAYGMSYRIATIGLALDTSKLCNYVLSNMLASSDSLHQAIIADDYKSIKTWNIIRFESILNMQLFYTANLNTRIGILTTVSYVKWLWIV